MLADKEPILSRQPRLLEKCCWVDVGARSKRQEERMGLSFLPASVLQAEGWAPLLILFSLNIGQEMMSRFQLLSEKPFCEVKRVPQTCRDTSGCMTLV